VNIEIITGPIILIQTLDSLLVIKDSVIRELNQIELFHFSKDYFIGYSKEKKKYLKFNVDSKGLHESEFNIPFIYSNTFVCVAENFNGSEIFIGTKLKQIVHLKNGKTQKIINLKGIPMIMYLFYELIFTESSSNLVWMIPTFLSDSLTLHYICTIFRIIKKLKLFKI
jgi:hypothetical protein